MSTRRANTKRSIILRIVKQNIRHLLALVLSLDSLVSVDDAVCALELDCRLDTKLRIPSHKSLDLIISKSLDAQQPPPPFFVTFPLTRRTPKPALLHELQNVPPQVVRLDDIEGQRPPKNAGLLLLLLLLLLILHGVIFDLLPGALRLSRVELGAKPRKRREDGVAAGNTAEEAEVRHDIRVTGGKAALRQNRAAGEG